jgi:hypothetical protein
LRAEVEAKLTSEKEEEIKMVEAEILQLKADIYNLKVLRKIFRNLKNVWSCCELTSPNYCIGFLFRERKFRSSKHQNSFCGWFG